MTIQVTTKSAPNGYSWIISINEVELAKSVKKYRLRKLAETAAFRFMENIGLGTGKPAF